jgi:acyl-CoA thioesterase
VIAPEAASRRREVQTLYGKDRAAQALGMEVLEVEPGAVRVAMTVRPDMNNGHEICHGGFIFTLADTAFAYACNAAGVAMVAAGASIEFLSPAVVGERLVATARETSRSERGGLYDVVVETEAGETRAHFRGRCARRRVPPPRA